MVQLMSCEEARACIEAGEATVVDIRDAESRRSGHIPSSVHLTNDSLPGFLAGADRDRPVIVYCYVGHSSQMAARLLVGRGFNRVYSMTGGFDAWRARYPDHCRTEDDGAAPVEGSRP